MRGGDGLDNKQVVEWPKYTERHWYVTACSLVFIGLAISMFVTGWVIEAPTIEQMTQRIDVVGPFVTIYLALITFCTVAWRGMVNSRQADQQRRQNDANDTANFAKILQEGAKLLGESEKTHVLAGIASLSIVLTEEKRRFAQEAMDLVADYVAEHYDGTYNSRMRAAIRTLEEGAHLGIVSRAEGTFEGSVEIRQKWVFVPGFKRLHYRGGIFRKRAFALLEKADVPINLTNVRVESSLFRGQIDCDNCIFVRCQFREIYTHELSLNRFEGCDFSGANILHGFEEAQIQDLRPLGNYYIADTPPSGKGADEWIPMLHCFATHLESMNFFAQAEFADRH